jgi:hypothetical protein
VRRRQQHGGVVERLAAGREDWAPARLLRWSCATAFAGLLTFIAMATGGAGTNTYGFVIVPVGVGWMAAAGVVLLRRTSTARRRDAVPGRAV